MKTLYFEGAGWEKAEVSKATIGNCRIRTAFHLDNGQAVYLEITGNMANKRTKENYPNLKYIGFVDFLHYITNEEPNDDCNKHRLPQERNGYISYDAESILKFVNGLGASFDKIEVLPNLAGFRVHADNLKYNFADEFKPNWSMISRANKIYEYIYNIEKKEGKKFPSFILYNDSMDINKLHLIRYNNNTRNEWLIDASNDNWMADFSLKK